ncbi:Inositol 1 [Nibea albiflora]|nr:Inositol 1 [Nibea albiflora]
MKEAQMDIKATVSVNVGEMTHKANEKELDGGGTPFQAQSIAPVNSAMPAQLAAEQKENFLRNQNNKTTTTSCVRRFSSWTSCVEAPPEVWGLLGLYINESNVHLITQTLETLTEYCQGPCQENQSQNRNRLPHRHRRLIVSDVYRDPRVETASTSITALILNDISPLCRYRMEMVLELKDNASKLLLALMESRHDNENAERILFNLRPRELLNLNNRPLSQMLKSSAPAAVVEQDPLEYYDQLTSQIEIVREDRVMEQIVFPVHPICEFLTEESKFRPLTLALLRSIYHLGIGNTLILLGSLNLINKVVFVVSFVGNNGTFIMGYKAMVMDVEFIYHLAYALTSTLGLFLFDLIYREETLFNVIKSVTRNGRSILLTALLALILVYLFSIVGFLCLKEDFIMEVDPWHRSPQEPLFPARVVYDLLFYFIVIIIVLNLISSVSSSTRLERDKFDNKTVSFEEHIKLEHNIWNYLYFIVLVREKNKTDYTGPESYVAHMIRCRRHLETLKNTL